MKKVKRVKVGTVVWAVDPFERESRPTPTGAREIARWAKRAGCQLLPAYVMTLVARDQAEGRFPRPGDAQAAMARYLRGFGLRGLAEPCVILNEDATRAGAVRLLLQLAEEKGAPWIVVSSHGRGGLERLVLGSFAEALLRESGRPVVFLSSRPRPAAKGRGREKAVFATDFSSRSLEAFGLFLGEAARGRFAVILVHSLAYPIPAMDGFLGLGSSLTESYFSELEAWARAEGRKWVELAEKRGVKARFVLRTGGDQAAVGPDILDLAAKENASLVAMTSLSGPLAQLVVGSPPYDVFRARRCPVWIYGPKALPARQGLELGRRARKTDGSELAQGPLR